MPTWLTGAFRFASSKLMVQLGIFVIQSSNFTGGIHSLLIKHCAHLSSRACLGKYGCGGGGLYWPGGL